MKKIEINISHAKIEGFSVSMETEIPRIAATIWLYTQNEKKISTYTVTNQRYYWEEIEFPPEIFDGLYRILDVIEWTVTRNAQSKIWLLPAKTERQKNQTKKPKMEDFDDIPF